MLPPPHVTRRGGLLITTPARTWLDCSALVPYVYTVAIGDYVLREGLASREDLEAIAGWARRRRGVCNARKAVPILDPRAESPGESLTRALLFEARLDAPECNVDIFCDGRWLARDDMVWRAERLIV